MLRSSKFWEDEFKIPLLKLDQGFLKAEGIEKVIERVSTWKSLAGVEESDIKNIQYGDQKPDEIFILDAARTFSTKENQERLVRVLTYLKQQFGDYQQGLSFVTSFLMLSIPEEENIAIMLKINSMLPGYWRHEAIDYGTSALTFYNILTQIKPKITEHLSNNLIQPETFCQKWFLGLFVHLLPFKYLFQFMEQFLSGGVEYLYQFGLSLFNVLGERILATNDVNVIYALLRLESNPAVVDQQIIDKDFQAIVDGTTQFDIKKYDLPAISKQVYETQLKSRIEKAHKVHAQVVEIPDCQWCNDDLPEFYCIQCQQVICENCIEEFPEDHDHDDTHKTVDMIEYEDNRSKYPLRKEEEEEEEEEEDIVKGIKNISIK